MAKSIFRKTSIDRLSSPEQLDKLIPVTDTKSWLALGMLLAMLATAIVWSIVGALPSRVSGDGILITAGGRVFDAVAPADGVLEEITVAVDDLVEKGQIVAVLSQRDLQLQFDAAQATLQEFEADLARITDEVDQQEALRIAAIEESIRSADERLATVIARLEQAEKRLADEKGLFERGISTNPRVLERQLAVDDIDREVNQLEQQLAELEVSRFDGNVSGIQRKQDARRLVNEARRDLTSIEAQLERGTAIVAPDAGRVTEVQAAVGTIVARGQPAISFESLGDGLELVLYVPPQYGKSVQSGMKVQISPKTAPREEYGTVLGSVSSVSGFPSTVEGMMAVVRNSELVRQFSSDGPPYRARVRLQADPDSVSGYHWTSDRGDELDLRSGTLANAEVTVRSQKPIEMVIPILREWTGL
jgi:HlyD family secretion protein